MKRSNNASDLIKLCNKIVVSISVNKYPNIWDIANNNFKFSLFYQKITLLNKYIIFNMSLTGLKEINYLIFVIF